MQTCPQHCVSKSLKRRRRLFRRLLGACLLAGSLAGGNAFAFPTEDDNTPGSMALAYKKENHIWLRVDAAAVDAKIKSSPPDSTKFDRRLESLEILGFDAAVTPRFGVRVNAKAETSKQRQAESEGPTAQVDSTIVKYSPSADLTFVTDKGLELFGGILYQLVPAYTETVAAGSVNSKTQYSRSTLQEKRFGVVRRSEAWSGGFYYRLGAQTERDYAKSASDGSSINASETVFLPPKVGVFGEFNAASVLWDFELDFVQARGKGPKDETGSTIYTDYFQARAGAYFQVSGGLGFKLSASHQTLSYASNAFVSLDTIPVTSMQALAVFGDAKSQIYVGMIGAYGEDGQSLPEFNAAYHTTAAGLIAGFIFPL